ncbi:secreted trypsin-like serine protease [Alloactinosynnema sp. L-07]|uniref:S1 family peptidase n=1 Tax=Alloactinosynnema sp. L-07 TaxID=1653480 RepID=UPI00065EF86B|nr:serine protease [Alloactinosynnema sp. L-07]CRK58574.1 secreted trypsin-like serine protease [Alloactinosynnema sp. L-07]
MGGTVARRILGVIAAIAIITVILGQFVAHARQDIVGGTRAKIADHPYIVYIATRDGYQFCGGTLVAKDKVVTAAHCAQAYDANDIRVVAGREDKRGTDGVEVRVAKSWIHPEFGEVVGGSDVAVLTLAEPLAQRPLTVADDADAYKPGTRGVILGWGRTSDGGPTSRYLLKAEVPIIADASCAESYAGFSAASMVCAGYPEGGVDSCQGDSGGPLVVAGRLVGVASWGEGCAEAGKPGVYTRVASYADDIKAQLDQP